MRQTIQQLSSKTLPPEAVKELRTAGFLDYEIEQFAKGSRKPVDLTMPIWQRAMQARKQWIALELDRGFTRTALTKMLQLFYAQDERRTPWDFLSHVYKPKKKVSITATIISERAARRRREIDENSS